MQIYVTLIQPLEDQSYQLWPNYRITDIQIDMLGLCQT